MSNKVNDQIVDRILDVMPHLTEPERVSLKVAIENNDLEQALSIVSGHEQTNQEHKHDVVIAKPDWSGELVCYHCGKTMGNESDED